MNNLRIQRILLRSLRETIKEHGPITKDLIGSVTKRAMGQIDTTHQKNNEKK